MKLSIDVDQEHKQFAYDLLQRELGTEAEDTKNKLSEKIIKELKNNPTDILETLYFLRLNNSQKNHKLALNLRKKALAEGLDDFSLAILRNIFAGDNKQMIFKKYKGIKACLDNVELTLALKEFLLKSNPENIQVFLEEVYDFTKYKDLNFEITKKAEYQSFAKALITSKIPDINSRKKKPLKIKFELVSFRMR